MSDKSNKTEQVLVIFIAILCTILCFTLFPVLATLGFWIEGWIIQLLVGSYICNAAALLGFSLMPSQIPTVFIALGWIGYGLNMGPDYADSIITKIWTTAFGEEILGEKEDEQ